MLGGRNDAEWGEEARDGNPVDDVSRASGTDTLEGETERLWQDSMEGMTLPATLSKALVFHL